MKICITRYDHKKGASVFQLGDVEKFTAKLAGALSTVVKPVLLNVID